MQFLPTNFVDVWLVQIEPIHDNRGFFARTFSHEEFQANGLETNFPQHSMSFTSHQGTIRGMHFQREPHSEIKLVRCLSGAIWDVVIDIRPDSPTFRQWQAFELSNDNRRQLYVPTGFAHGFQTLTDHVQVSYLISTPYAQQAAGGARHNDPSFGITWPLPVTMLSDRDARWPDFARVDD